MEDEMDVKHRQHVPLGLLGALVSRRFVNKACRKLCYEPTYQLTPKEKPCMSAARKVIRTVLDSQLSNYVYNANTASSLTLSLSDDIKRKVHLLDSVRGSRYRIFVHVTVGEPKGQAIQIASRGSWSESVDSHITCTLQKASFFTVATVYFVYKE